MAYYGNSCKERVFAVRKKSNNVREEQNESYNVKRKREE
jgi:hypothetical protein